MTMDLISLVENCAGLRGLARMVSCFLLVVTLAEAAASATNEVALTSHMEAPMIPKPTASPLQEFTSGLGSLPLLSDAQTRSISPENPTGEKGKGAMMIPKIGDPEQPHADRFAASWPRLEDPAVPQPESRGDHDAHGRGRAGSDPAHLDGGGTGSHTFSASTGTASRRPRSRCPLPISSRWATASSPRSIPWPSSSIRQRHELLLADAVPQARPDHAHQRDATRT